MKKRGTVSKKAQKSFEKAKPKVKPATPTKKKIDVTKREPEQKAIVEEAFEELDKAVTSAFNSEAETNEEYNRRINKLKAQREGLL
jgi:hypothetical protein